MLIWQEFAAAWPDMAQTGYDLLYQFGIGLAFLATVRKDGGPRLHPVCPLIDNGHLLVFVVGTSPKRYDLLRDRRYALYTFPPKETDDEFYCTDNAYPITDAAWRDTAARWTQQDVQDDEVLFELRL